MTASILRTTILTICCFVCTNSYEINQISLDIQPYEEECFFEYVNEESQIHLRVQVSEGGFLDIAFKEILPNGTENVSEKSTDDIVYHLFDQNGTYKFCLNNEMSTLTTKTVKLAYIVLTKEEYDKAVSKARINDTVENDVEKLNEKFRIFSVEHWMMASRQENHRRINERTNSWVLWWAVFECLTIISLTVGQIYYIKRFFEVRRVV